MIVQDAGGGLLLFRQTDHALLSAAYAAAWGNERFGELRRRDRLLVAAARHDDGWSEWELAPRTNESGRPVDFIGIPVNEHVVIYRRGIDLVEAEDAYAGCVVSMHGERLYTRPFHPGMRPRIEHLEGDGRAAAERYVEHERARQERLVRALAEADAVEAAEVERDLEEAWRLLQVWDRLSLFVCMQRFGSGASYQLPPVSDADGRDVAIGVRTDEAGCIRLDPYPFSASEARFDVAALEMRTSSWKDDAAFRRDYRSAPVRVVRFAARPG